MTEVGPSDLSRLLQTKRNECSAIVTSRKRKLRELFAVATQVDPLPDHALANPDAPAATPAEWQFLQASDILQGKTLNEVNIPARPRLSLERLKRSLAEFNKIAAPLNAASPSAPGLADARTAKVRKQAPSEDAPVVPNGEGLPVATPNATPIPSAKLAPTPTPTPTPTPPSQQDSTRSLPQGQKNAGVAPVQQSRHDDGTAQAGRGVAGPNSKGTQQGQRTAQVAFPPGTKGSPSADAASVVDGSTGKPASALDAKRDADASNTHRDTNGALSIKLPTDVAKISEAVSTPGSTAASATTPAPHESSTDTSPDNDGPRSLDVAGQREQDEDAVAKGLLTVSDPLDQSQTPEAQLFRESVRRSAETSNSATKTSPIAPMPTAPRPADETKARPISKPESKPASAAAGPEQLPVSTGAPRITEVPDSEGGSPDEMDIDVPENVPAQESKVLASREPNIPTQEAPALPPTRKESMREQSQDIAPERAVTRVSSGAMRLKSVTEIVGGAGRQAQGSDREPTTKTAHDQLTPVTSTPQSPASRIRTAGLSRKDRQKGQTSTVLFGKQPKRVEDRALVPGHKDSLQASDDYYTPLFVQNFSGSPNWMQPLERILFQANKTISTPDAHLVIQDHQACRVLRRVYHLQQHDKWSLRQPKRCPEPTRPASQQDVLLQEMKWMRTDFREERKWKMAVARNLAHACAEWLEATPEVRKTLQVAAVIPPKTQLADGDVPMVDAEAPADSQSTPELVSSGDVDSPQNIDEIVEDLVETVAPSAIFTLQEDDVVFGLRRTPAADKLLEELPMYGPPLQVPKVDIAGPEYDPDAHWKRSALPLSKYVEGEMKLALPGPPRSRGRFAYTDEDSDDADEGGFVADQLVHTFKLPPTTDEVSLFHPDSKHIRDRLHAGHQFRPPSEHAMPTQSFFEARNPSQWTLTEDDELRGLVREFSYNWSLISSMLSTRSLFSAGAERRTPWECFERWINLEGLPADMQKTQYFKSYNGRIEGAQRVIAQQNQIAAQQASASGGAVTPVRRRPSVPMRVERRRNQRHLTMIDAMRKLAKKRETAVQKQQHSASQSNANKKTNDNVSQRPAKTPRDYSLMRWERDQALAEKMAQYAQRQELQRRAAIAARAQQGQGGAAAAAAGAQGQNANHPGANPGVNGGPRPISNQLAAAAAAVAASQGRQRMQIQPPANNVGAMQGQMNGGLSAPAQMNGTPQAQQMQGMQGQHRMPMPNQQPDASLMLRAQRISEQQRAAVQIQQAQHHQPQQQQANGGTPGPTGPHHSPPMRNGINGMTQQNFMNNAQAIMASYNAAAAANAGGHSSPPPPNGLHMPSAAAAASPGQRPHPQLPPAIAVQLQHLETSFRAKNPNLTPEQARQLATEHLTRAMVAQRQNAMNAAAGASGQPGIANSIAAATSSPHQYAALLRQQQQQQAQAQAQAQAQQQQAQQQQLQQQQQHGQPQHHQQQPQQQPQQHPQAHQIRQQQAHQQKQTPQQTPPQQPQQQPQQQQHQPPLQQQQQQQQQAQRNSVSQAPSTNGTPTPGPASASPVQAHQRAASGSATPSAAGK
ncbi:RNA polymerase II transcription elongation factor SpEAF [Purpureocillium takamizusanense]|uniref:Vacuolar import and degradation protein 21 n=1 Tax=Purpureocillium takamizusanense TaxID=2060973 RepID=A0A9Q8QI81_9HYPO|nr:RNA polymerase II transcription elongation factor SpEAF [Purpureocillium takamizusanense]UNI21429.1 RNA polymerase II transcription elongation factor SpEAF [Purpureocillium takamizusanense]